MSGIFDRLFQGEPLVQVNLEPRDESFTAKLVSCVPGTYFRADFSVRVFTTRSELPPEYRSWLRRRLIHEAEASSRRVSVSTLENTTVNINYRIQNLSWKDLPQSPRVTVLVTLTTSADELKIAAEWESLQARLALTRMTEELDLERLRHLREDIFRQPEVARTYWLDRHPDALAEALGDNFERIAEKLGSGPGPTTMTIAHLLRDFLADLPAAEKSALLDLVRRVFQASSRSELADQLPPEIT
jgi:hypothetical protein